MFLCRVALGRTLNTTEPLLDLQATAQALQAGHDSVTGLTVADGGKLNFEENVVYSSAAAIPSYIIIYKI